MRILVAEDERKVASFIRQGLEEEGHAVEVAADGDIALALAADGPPFDLVVLDVMLPKRDGFSVLRALGAAKVATPVLMLTARDSVADKVTGLDAGADDYLAKPFAFEELLARVRALLRRAAVRVLTMPVVRRGAVVRLVQVGMDLERTQRALTAFVHTLFFLVPLGVGLAVAGGMVIARRALRPVDQMSRAARRITAENLTGRIEPPGAADEMDRLAETLNGMLARLDAAFGHLRRFAADAAHELRTPLTVLKGGLEVALRTDRSAAEYRAVLASSLQEVEGLIRLTEDLLLFSRATAGLEGPRVRLELEPLVLEVAEMGVRLAKPGGVSVRLGLVQPAAVIGDGASLRRAVVNLIENAVRYSDAGGAVELTLTQEGGYALIVVSDRGPGIAPADVERIFEPFVRLDVGRARYAGGTGLGLAIARSIVAAHGGTLTVDSAPGAGARFTVRLLLA